MILGTGSDLCDIRRIERSLERFGERFTHRVFTAGERAKSDRRAARAPSYARRFAAKEACSKALGTGLGAGVFWRDMEVVNLPGGRPTMRLTGGAARRLAALTPEGYEAVVHVTLTDEPPLAQAFVIIEALRPEEVAAVAKAATNARIRAMILRQAQASAELGSPFTARICRLLAENLDTGSAFGRRILSWPGDAREDALALRAAGALNALARSGRDAGLSAAYPPSPASGETEWPVIAAAIAAHDAFLTAYLDSPPQTNEVKRSTALLGGALILAGRYGLPFDLCEIGASAGLNLAFDRYGYQLGAGRWGPIDAAVAIPSDWRGNLPPLAAPLTIARRRGCDISPLDPSDPEHRARVLSYIWPDQRERVQLTEAAFDMAEATSWRVEQADAAPFVERWLAEPQAAGTLRLLTHTIMWQYLPAETRGRIEAAMAAAGARADETSPLAWLRLEADASAPGAGLLLTTWPDGVTQEIARGDFHGRWVEWR